ncbi:MAG TPA: respiratory nitrate reductase subunit gamma [Miltoncostaeaceae bacterium]|jgi:nitrate reductase gamma subunit|nr:respiratory nitrate reductase subunit gamma [Miltoncostaeaceae bacterium]
MSRTDLLLWLVLPYVSMTVFVVGHVWRYRHDQLGWTTRSTQLLESRRLRAGVLLFHLGLFAVLGGHVLGILVPASLTERVGVSEDLYHAVSVTAGTASGVAMLAGFVLLLARRTTDRRVRATTTHTDRLTYGLLGVMLVTGMYATVGENLLLGGYDYRETVAPWFRGLFTLDPDTSLIAGAPLVYKLHAAAAWLLYALWPFSRLVHAWSVPVGYLRRSHILYRSRRPGAVDRDGRPRAAA